jgi:hypothetical protein
MRRALLKMAFVIAVVVLTIVFLIPATVVLDAMFPMGRTADGHYQSGDRLLPAIVAIALSISLSDRIVSFLFRVSRLTEERWSVFGHRLRRRPG